MEVKCRTKLAKVKVFRQFTDKLYTIRNRLTFILQDLINNGILLMFFIKSSAVMLVLLGVLLY